MASKHKITAYTSDTCLYEWAVEAAKKKGMTKSEYLESLIREEMQRPEKKEVPSVLKNRFIIFKRFTPKEDILSHSFDCELLAPAPSTSLRIREKEIYSQLGHGINKDINKDFFNAALGKYIPEPESDFHTVFVKVFYDGRIYKNKETISLRCRNHVVYQPLLVTRELWDMHEGRYDFFNIIYLRQYDLIRGTAKDFAEKYAGVSPLFEKIRSHNDSGGFFIPVLRNSVSLEQRLMSADLVKKLAGSDCLYKGVSEGNNKERFCLKGRELI